MSAQPISLSVYRMNRGGAETPRDADLVNLAEHFPQMMAVLEEVQALRWRVDELEDQIAHST